MKVKLTVWERVCWGFIADKGCLGSSSKMTEWCGSPGRPPLRLCPIQSETLFLAGWKQNLMHVSFERVRSSD